MLELLQRGLQRRALRDQRVDEAVRLVDLVLVLGRERVRGGARGGGVVIAAIEERQRDPDAEDELLAEVALVVVDFVRRADRRIGDHAVRGQVGVFAERLGLET